MEGTDVTMTFQGRYWDETMVKNERALGYIIGAMYGDGSVFEGGVRLPVKDREFSEEFARVARSLGFSTCRSRAIVHNDGPFTEAVIHSVYFGRWCLREKYEHHYSNVEFRRGFIRGIFDAEGSAVVTRAKRNYVRKNYSPNIAFVHDPYLRPKWRADICNSDLPLLRMINDWVRNFGFKSCIYKLKKSKVPIHLKNGHTITTKKTPYRIQMNGKDNVRRFLAFANSSIPSKRLEFADAKVQAWNLPPKTNIKPCWKLKVPLEQIRDDVSSGRKTMADVASEQDVSAESVARWLGLRPNQVPQTLYPNGLESR